MGLNFKIIETTYDKEKDEERYRQIKQDYLNGLRREEISEKYGFGATYYDRHIVPRIKEDGIWNIKKYKRS